MIAWNTCGNYVKVYNDEDSYFVLVDDDGDKTYLAGKKIDSLSLISKSFYYLMLILLIKFYKKIFKFKNWYKNNIFINNNNKYLLLKNKYR